MIKRFINDGSTLYVDYKLNDFDTDTITIGVINRSESSTITLIRDIYIDELITGIEQVVNEYNDNDTEHTRQYVLNVDSDNTILAFGIIEREGTQTYLIYIRNDTKSATYKFRDDIELDKFLSFLKLIQNDEIHFITHLLYDELKQSIDSGNQTKPNW